MNKEIIISEKLKSRLVAYIYAIAGVIIASLLRLIIVHYSGPNLATYITFYPFVIFVAVLGGFGPGLLTTLISALVVDYWFLTPQGVFKLENLADLIGAILFIIMGVLISIVIEYDRRSHDKQEEALRQVNIYNRSLLEASLDPLVTISREGRITDANDATIKITGVLKEKLIGTDFSDYFTEPEKAKDGYQQVFIKGFVSDYPLTIRGKDGELTDVLYNATVYKDDRGNILGVFAAARDITKQNNAEQKLKESYALLEQKVQDRTQDLEKEKANLEKAKAKDEAYLSSIGEGVFAIDTSGKILMINSAAAEMLKYTKEELLGKYYFNAIKMGDENGKEISREKRPLSNVLKTRKKQSRQDYTYFRKDGKFFPINVTTAPIEYDQKVIGLINVFRDITKEKEIDKAKSEFVSLASHQLRTPLSAVNWYAEMLMAGDVGELKPEQKKYLEEIYKGNQRMVDLVNALLDVSRIELGTFAIEPVPTDLIDIAKSLAHEMNQDLVKKKIDLQEKYDKNLPKINADPKLIRIVIQNILSNAIKYTPDKGKITLIIGKDEDNVKIEISDTGYGIPECQQSQIFTKLFRADNVREKDAEGTGLGLYIAKSIIEQSGGKIWFKSIEGKGTSFYLIIPLKGMPKKEGAKVLEDIK